MLKQTQYYTSDSKSAYQEVHPQLGLCNAHNLEKKPPTMWTWVHLIWICLTNSRLSKDTTQDYKQD